MSLANTPLQKLHRKLDRLLKVIADAGHQVTADEIRVVVQAITQRETRPESLIYAGMRSPRAVINMVLAEREPNWPSKREIIDLMRAGGYHIKPLGGEGLLKDAMNAMVEDGLAVYINRFTGEVGNRDGKTQDTLMGLPHWPKPILHK